MAKLSHTTLLFRYADYTVLLKI